MMKPGVGDICGVKGECATLINVFTVDPSKQQQLVD